MSNLITQILESPDCIPTCLPEAEKATLQNAMGRLFARGYLKVPGPRPFISLPGAEPAPSPSAPVATVVKPAAMAPVSATETLERIMQREINAFILESFGRFLKPSLLSAIRRDYDPNFSEEKLDQLLQARQTAWSQATISAFNPASATTMGAAPMPAVASPPSPTAALPAGEIDYLQEVISLIMEATGYERDEIEPEMDLRSDLAIRSSRLPVIMDAAETRFGIEIRLEDFMEVRTVQDLASQITAVAARSSGRQELAAGIKAAPEAAGGSRGDTFWSGKPTQTGYF